MQQRRLILTFVIILAALPSIYLSGIIGYFRTLDGTMGKSNNCEAHHIQMERIRVPVDYGFISRIDITGKGAQFPHVQADYLGGCVWSPESPKHAWVYVCKDCEEAGKRAYLQYQQAGHP